jgi:hypothetical protein
LYKTAYFALNHAQKGRMFCDKHPPFCTTSAQNPHRAVG